MNKDFPIEIFDKGLKDVSNKPQLNNKLQMLKKQMQKDLAKTKDFAERLLLITDTAENITRILNGKRVLTHDEMRKLKIEYHQQVKEETIRKKIKQLKRIKKIKCLKKPR